MELSRWLAQGLASRRLTSFKSGWLKLILMPPLPLSGIGNRGVDCTKLSVRDTAAEAERVAVALPSSFRELTPTDIDSCSEYPLNESVSSRLTRAIRVIRPIFTVISGPGTYFSSGRADCISTPCTSPSHSAKLSRVIVSLPIKEHTTTLSCNRARISEFAYSDLGFWVK